MGCKNKVLGTYYNGICKQYCIRVSPKLVDAKKMPSLEAIFMEKMMTQ